MLTGASILNHAAKQLARQAILAPKGSAVTRNLMLFERLAYASLAVGVVDTIIDKTSDLGEKVLTLILIGVVGVLVFTAARRGSVYGGLLFTASVVLLVLFTWAAFGGPAWLRFFAPEVPLSTLDKGLGVIATALGVAAVCFYLLELLHRHPRNP